MKLLFCTFLRAPDRCLSGSAARPRPPPGAPPAKRMAASRLQRRALFCGVAFVLASNLAILFRSQWAEPAAPRSPRGSPPLRDPRRPLPLRDPPPAAPSPTVDGRCAAQCAAARPRCRSCAEECAAAAASVRRAASAGATGAPGAKGPKGAAGPDLPAPLWGEEEGDALFARTGFRSAWSVPRLLAFHALVPHLPQQAGPEGAILLSRRSAEEHREAFHDVGARAWDLQHGKRRAARELRMATGACDDVTMVITTADRSIVQGVEIDRCLALQAATRAPGSDASLRFISRNERLDAEEASTGMRYHPEGRVPQGSGTKVRASVVMSPSAEKSSTSHRALFEERLLSLLHALPALEEALLPVLSTMSARARDRGGHVVSMAVNGGQLPLLVNWLCSARAANISTDNVLVFAADASVARALESVGLASFYHESFGSFPEKAAKTYADRSFALMMTLKTIALYLPLQLGFDTLFQDADLIWFDDPANFFARDTRVDTYWMDDGARGPRYAPFFANSGFMFLRSNGRTRRYAREVLGMDDLVRAWGSQQSATCQLLADAARRHGLSVVVLSKRDFIPGHQFHKNKGLMQRIVDGRHRFWVFHICWTKNAEEKVRILQEEMDMWFLRAGAEDAIRGLQDGEAGARNASLCHAPARWKDAFDHR